MQKIPDGLSSSNEDITQDLPSLCESLEVNCSSPLKDLIRRLSFSVTVIASEVFMGFTSEVAEEFKIPLALFWTSSSCGFMGYCHYRGLIERGLIPLKGMYVIYVRKINGEGEEVKCLMKCSMKAKAFVEMPCSLVAGFLWSKLKKN